MGLVECDCPGTVCCSACDPMPWACRIRCSRRTFSMVLSENWQLFPETSGASAVSAAEGPGGTYSGVSARACTGCNHRHRLQNPPRVRH